MRDFFFVRGDDHLYSRDMRLAKYWMELKTAE